MLELNDINKKFAEFSLKNINISVDSKDYYVLLGSSGSGKSVLLEIIAGLVKQDSGIIKLNGNDISHSPIQKRNIALVFQDYAIFPHLNVFENIAFPLRQKKMYQNEIINIVESISKELEIEKILHRKTSGLSGGEKQRVSLARALAMKPQVLLLDEPLAAIDAQLKNGLRMLLRKLNNKGQSIIHVTHDYEEALLLASKVAVINKGVIEQTGEPREVFSNPKSEFIANLIGIRNFYKAKLIERHDKHNTGKLLLNYALPVFINSENEVNEGVAIIRSTDVVLSLEKNISSALNCFNGKIIDILTTKYGFDIVIDIGIPIHSAITEESYINLNIAFGKNIFVSFKASSIKFIS